MDKLSLHAVVICMEGIIHIEATGDVPPACLFVFVLPCYPVIKNFPMFSKIDSQFCVSYWLNKTIFLKNVMSSINEAVGTFQQLKMYC